MQATLLGPLEWELILSPPLIPFAPSPSSHHLAPARTFYVSPSSSRPSLGPPFSTPFLLDEGCGGGGSFPVPRPGWCLFSHQHPMAANVCTSVILPSGLRVPPQQPPSRNPLQAHRLLLHGKRSLGDPHGTAQEGPEEGCSLESTNQGVASGALGGLGQEWGLCNPEPTNSCMVLKGLCGHPGRDERPREAASRKRHY